MKFSKLYIFFLFQATTEKNSFTKQVKKGLSNIVNLSRGTVSSSSSEVNAKKIKLAAAVASTTKAQVLQSSQKIDQDHFTVQILFNCNTQNRLQFLPNFIGLRK